MYGLNESLSGFVASMLVIVHGADNVKVHGEGGAPPSPPLQLITPISVTDTFALLASNA